jgi:predicted Fe-Mo cluster-binding NifX family protein
MGLREPSSKGWLSRTRPDARPASLPRGDGVKDMGKKVNEEAMLEQRAKEEALKKEALDFYRQLKERNLPHFDGASIDFHRKRDPVVFIPGENPVLTAVRREELMDFLKANNVNRVLVDALFPSRVPMLQSLLEHGIEVYVLRRPTALAGFKAMLERRYNKKKKDGNNNDNNGIKIPRKNDFVDAVALAFTWPKFHRKIEIPYLICWRAMNRWRRSYMLYYKVQQMLSEDEDESPVVTLHEDRLIKKAKMFVDTVEMHYPKIRQVFEEVRIPEDDVIAQALCSEIALETYHLKKFSRVLRKAGIGIQSVPKKKVRKKKEEVEKTEDKQTENRPKRKVFQYDGKLLFAANQLAVKLFHLDPIKESEKVMLKTKKLLEEIWKRSRKLQMTEEYGRVGEALGCPAPLEKRGMKQL